MRKLFVDCEDMRSGLASTTINLFFIVSSTVDLSVAKIFAWLQFKIVICVHRRRSRGGRGATPPRV